MSLTEYLQDFCFGQRRNLKSMIYSLSICTVVQLFHLRQFGLTWKIKRVKERSLRQCYRLSQKSLQFWVRVISLQYGIFNKEIITFLYIVVMHAKDTSIFMGKHRLIIYLRNWAFQIGEEEGRFLYFLSHNSWAYLTYLTPVFCLAPSEMKCSSPVQSPFVGCVKQTYVMHICTVYRTVGPPNWWGSLEDSHSINITWQYITRQKEKPRNTF